MVPRQGSYPPSYSRFKGHGGRAVAGGAWDDDDPSPASREWWCAPLWAAATHDGRDFSSSARTKTRGLQGTKMAPAAHEDDRGRVRGVVGAVWRARRGVVAAR